MDASINRDFCELPANISPWQALQRMDAANKKYGVVFDEDGVAASLIVREDLEQASRMELPFIFGPRCELPPTMFMRNDVTVAQAAATRAVTLLEFGSRGAVVMGETSVYGVVPAAAFMTVLGSGSIAPLGRQMTFSLTDGQLGGLPRVPPGKVVCSTCGQVNVVDYLDPDNLPECQNLQPPKHQLKLKG